jgi:site-specific recombinase XerD
LTQKFSNIFVHLNIGAKKKQHFCPLYLKIEVGDVDLAKATLKIQGGKKHSDRTVPLKATQIGLFINYLQNIRPQMLEFYTAENKLRFVF